MNRKVMVETVAKAIARADEYNGSPSYDERIKMGKTVKTVLFDEAEAAVDAMTKLVRRDGIQ